MIIFDCICFLWDDFFRFFIFFIWVGGGRKCPDQEAEVKVSVSVTLEQMPSLSQTLKMIMVCR